MRESSRGREVTLALIGASAAMILAGLFTGEGMEVLRRAITICLECIGIG